MSRATSGLRSPIERFTRRMSTRIIAALARTLVEQELSVAQVASLYLLDERGQLGMGALAAELERSAAATSRLVDGLVRAGLVTRREDPADRRAKLIELTPAGASFVARASADRMKTIGGVVRDMPAPAVAELLAAAKRG